MNASVAMTENAMEYGLRGLLSSPDQLARDVSPNAGRSNARTLAPAMRASGRMTRLQENTDAPKPCSRSMGSPTRFRPASETVASEDWSLDESSSSWLQTLWWSLTPLSSKKLLSGSARASGSRSSSWSMPATLRRRRWRGGIWAPSETDPALPREVSTVSVSWRVLARENPIFSWMNSHPRWWRKRDAKLRNFGRGRTTCLLISIQRLKKLDSERKRKLYPEIQWRRRLEEHRPAGARGEAASRRARRRGGGRRRVGGWGRVASASDCSDGGKPEARCPRGRQVLGFGRSHTAVTRIQGFEY